MVINKPFILTAFSSIGIIIGMFVFSKPELTIEIQRKFYEKINWRIEPISMAKEIRNTKIMGIFLATVSLITIVSCCLKIIWR